jgi:hypothetical protein
MWVLRLIMAVPLLLAAAPPPAAITLPVEAPIMASINGDAVSLSLATGGVDRITLNLDTVARLGLKPATLMGKANLKVGRTKVLNGRNTPTKVTLFGQPVNQRVFWFEGAAMLPRQGSIGPFALPQGQVTVQLQAGTGRDFSLPLFGDINSGGYGVVRGAGYGFGLSVDVVGRSRLAVASAAVGADLAAALGGRLEGEPWQEEIVFGIARPVRRLVLDKPLEIGPFRLTEIAVRVTDRRDGTAQLAAGQQAVTDAEDDPAEIVVSGDSGKKRQVVRVLTLSRTQLDAAGCRAIRYDKPGGQLVLNC